MCKISEINDVDFSLFVKSSGYLYEIAQKFESFFPLCREHK